MKSSIFIVQNRFTLGLIKKRLNFDLKLKLVSLLADIILNDKLTFVKNSKIETQIFLHNTALEKEHKNASKKQDKN